jgi:deoxycytidylate deaminase
MDAKDGFLEKAVLLVANEGCAECEKSVLGLLVKRVVVDAAESIEAAESAREWEK